MIFICGHYEGFDERIRDYVDVELSIGDYVLTGGELGAMVVMDSVIRLLHGVITQASHEDEGSKVPDVLLSGHHENIRKWRLKESLRKTMIKRPDLLEKRPFTEEELEILKELKK